MCEFVQRLRSMVPVTIPSRGYRQRFQHVDLYSRHVQLCRCRSTSALSAFQIRGDSIRSSHLKRRSRVLGSREMLTLVSHLLIWPLRTHCNGVIWLTGLTRLSHHVRSSSQSPQSRLVSSLLVAKRAVLDSISPSSECVARRGDKLHRTIVCVYFFQPVVIGVMT